MSFPEPNGSSSKGNFTAWGAVLSSTNPPPLPLSSLPIGKIDFVAQGHREPAKFCVVYSSSRPTFILLTQMMLGRKRLPNGYFCSRVLFEKFAKSRGMTINHENQNVMINYNVRYSFQLLVVHLISHCVILNLIK
jgi:hypothetical protein